jgi:hypothetical protein
VQAVVLAVEGAATVRSIGAGQARPLVSSTHPRKGEIVETAGASRAALALLPNLLVQLDRDARLELVRLVITKDGNETGAAMQGRYAEARLLRGRMFVSHGWGEALAKFSVATPQGELVTNSNALFCIVTDEHKTRVTCVSGSVGFQARGAGEVTFIPPGFVGEWSGSTSNLIAAEADAHGQEELQDGLAVEEKLRVLSNQNRLVLPR